MKELFFEKNFNLSDKQIEKFESCYNLLIEYNNKFNITAITDKKEVYIKHFIDSILSEKEFNNYSLLDVGSGGGFPAIPLKIVNENLTVSMLEATEKKCEFLRAVVNNLNLTNVNVINGRAEEFALKKEYREGYDICSARAVARLNILAEYCMPFVKVGGTFLAFKGEIGLEELSEAENAIKTLGGQIDKIEEFDLFGNKRYVIHVKKIKRTDLKYPRKNGQIRKKPL
ncbi:MAG: 16S rRNA (guanine(527)-N(7))-methyltransferase RsmG [Clostridia bacterium]|nr:16S rRNA (guanine(527)-N(7))-methyltransferase RsmG [Clostridia bacterium]